MSSDVLNDLLTTHYRTVLDDDDFDSRGECCTEWPCNTVRIITEAEQKERPDWDEYYLGIAAAVSARGECTRRRVGAVIVRDHTIIATGYNGAPAGAASCLDGHCPRAGSTATPGVGYAASGCIAIHAEANAIIRAGRERTLGATIYITCPPCELCTPLIQAAGIARIVHP